MRPLPSCLPIRPAGLALLITVLLTGCSLNPAYQRPAVALPATLGTTTMAPSAADAADAAPLSADEDRLLREFSPDPRLRALVTDALRRNADFRVASRQVEQARALQRVERAAGLPTVALRSELKRTHFNQPDLEANYKEDYAISSLAVDFDLDFFGRVRSMSQAARERYLGSEQGLVASRAALIAEVLRAYTLERAAALTLSHVREANGYQHRLAAHVQRQREVGLIAADQARQSDHETVQSDAALMRAGEARRAAARALQLMTGSATAEDDGAPGVLPAPAAMRSWRDLDSHLLLNRPDVRQAEAELKASYADIGAARAAFFPSIRLSSGVGTVSEELGGLFKPGTRAWSFNPQIDLPIFSGGRNQAQLTIAELRKDAAIANYEKTIQTAFRDVADALEAQDSLAADEQVRRAQADLIGERAAAMARRAARELQDPQDVLAEQIQLQTSRAAQVAAQRDVVLNRIRLLQAFYGVTLPTGPQ